MPVRYTPPTPDALLPVQGVALGAAAGHIKNWQRDDVLLIVCEPGTIAGGVFTQNRFCAAPVTVCREHIAHQHRVGGSTRALVVNAGNANAGTGQPGLNAARSTCSAVAALLGCAPEEVLPFSTGVIMEPLPVERLVAALPAAHAAARADGWHAAARAIMTTDTVPKGASRRFLVDGVPITVTGIAKGAGMIRPNMATMLAFVATDAPYPASNDGPNPPEDPHPPSCGVVQSWPPLPLPPPSHSLHSFGYDDDNRRSGLDILG
jgi:glutamate N-acetyltransferase/amino-acid N-acetyltransferase